MSVAYLTIKNEKVIFTGDYLEAYVPDNLFKKDMNEYLGDIVHMMGIFNFRLGKNREVDSSSKLYTFNFPSMIMSRPSSTEIKELELIPGTGVKKYHILKYNNGDEFLTSTEVVKDISNVEKFVNLLLSGALPPTLKYEDILRMFYKNLEVNGETCNVSGVLLSVVVSELCRYKQDQSIPFRRVIGKDKAGQLDYKLANARSVCANNSTFSALTFEDIDTMLVYSVNKKRYNKKENESPLESIIQV